MGRQLANFAVIATPYRLSFVGGGTDLPAFYLSNGGAVVSVTLSHVLVTTAVRSVGRKLHLVHEAIETAEEPELLKHDISREALIEMGWRGGLHITLSGSLPPASGLGSSSTVAVSLVHALSTLRGEVSDPGSLAEAACRIEIERLGAPIGRQDQYAAAFGGLVHIVFGAGDRVEVTQLEDQQEILSELENHLLLFGTGIRRSSNEILRAQRNDGPDATVKLCRMRDAAFDLWKLLQRRPLDVPGLGALVRENWELKRSLNPEVTTPMIDSWILSAVNAGAYGGKLLGAGRHGFVLVIADRNRHEPIRRALGYPLEVPVRLSQRGSSVVDYG